MAPRLTFLHRCVVDFAGGMVEQSFSLLKLINIFIPVRLKEDDQSGVDDILHGKETDQI